LKSSASWALSVNDELCSSDQRWAISASSLSGFAGSNLGSSRARTFARNAPLRTCSMRFLKSFHRTLDQSQVNVPQLYFGSISSSPIHAPFALADGALALQTNTLRSDAPWSCASARSVPWSCARPKSAPWSCAPRRSAPWSFEMTSDAPWRFVRVRSAPSSCAPTRFAP
jgi:hypothetical protein